MPTERLTELLVYARRRIPWVQASLIPTEHDDRQQVRRRQEGLKAQGVWVSEPVPMFPYPGTPLYRQMFGEPDDRSWEQAHRSCRHMFNGKRYSDIQQQQQSAALEDLECTF